MLTRVLHTGTAVADLDQTTSLYQSLGFDVVKKFHKPAPDMDVVMLSKGDTTFEIFKFNDPSDKQIEFIENHVAIHSDSIERDVAELVKQGFKLTIPITEGVIFRYAFLQDGRGTNYEIATEKD